MTSRTAIPPRPAPRHRSTRSRRAGPALGATTLLLLAACGGGPGGSAGAGAGGGSPEEAATPAAAPSAPSSGTVRLGVSVLLADSVHIVRGRRAGLITNHTGLDWDDGVAHSTIDRLATAPGVELVALYSPEHGIRGRAEAGEKVASDVDPATGLPIHSLYGDTRKPTPAMLEGVDVLLFDIQDIGARYYTYVWTMALAMEAAGEAGIPFVVLDRPNPIGGRLVQGNVLEPAQRTFVGLYEVPMRHGLTAGELARLLVGEFGIDVALTVVPMEGWTRSTWYDETGLPFVAPSPNMPSLASATHYPGTCLFEGTNLSVGRGTDRAFQQVGAPWLDAEGIAAALNGRVEGEGGGVPGLRGVRFEAVTVVPESPGDGKFGGETVRAVRFVVTDRRVYDPTVAAIAALVEVRRRHPARLEWRERHFDRLAGAERVRRGVVSGQDAAAITAPWPAESAAFEALREPYLLYR